jgi:parallel beta-helix repeat protein
MLRYQRNQDQENSSFDGEQAQQWYVEPGSADENKRLQNAVEAAQDGAIIWMEPGTYTLDEPLLILRSVRLSGMGAEMTRIICEAEEYVLQYGGAGLFAVEGIAFEHRGNRWADVVLVKNGEVDLQRCVFTGAVWDALGEQGGTGLWLEGRACGSVTQCRMERNELHGMDISGESQMTVENNTCRQNGGAGIAFWDNAGGLARRNLCEDNTEAGIQACDQSAPLLEENICRGNKVDGIAFWDEAGGTALRNSCCDNEENGIAVHDESAPLLQANQCKSNHAYGIAFYDEAGGVARANTCLENTEGDISLETNGHPVLEGNFSDMD